MTLSSSVTASFSSSATSLLKIEEDKPEGGGKAEYGTAWVAVWCSDGTPTLSSTSGHTPNLINNGIAKTVTETVTFNNTTNASLPHCKVSDVTLRAVGTFLSSKGLPLPTPAIAIDTDTGELTTAVACFGAVSVTYTTIYARYRCVFARDPQATKGDASATPPIPASTSAFASMLVVAVKGDLNASVTLTPPPRSEDPKNGTGEGDGDGTTGGTKYNSGDSSPNNSGKSGNIVIELSNRYIDGYVSDSVNFFAEIYVYFGLLDKVTPIVSSGSIDLGYRAPTEFVDIQGEQLTWSGQSTTSTKYLPASSGPLDVKRISSAFQCKHQNSVLESFNSSVGKKIQPKVFHDDGSYTAGDAVEVKLGNVVVTEFGMSVDVTGNAVVNYTTARTAYDVHWARAYTPGGAPPPSVTVSVTVGEFSGSLVIDPASLRGRK